MTREFALSTLLAAAACTTEPADDAAPRRTAPTTELADHFLPAPASTQSTVCPDCDFVIAPELDGMGPASGEPEDAEIPPVFLYYYWDGGNASGTTDTGVADTGDTGGYVPPPGGTWPYDY